MNDFEGAVRAMLRERASDIATLPRAIGDLETVELLDTRGHRHTGWLVAAAVAAILAIVGVVFAVRPGSHGKPVAPATQRATTTHASPGPTLPQTGHAARDVRLTWFGMKPLPGYALHMREAKPGYRVLAVRQNADTGIPVGCNGCESASDYIFVVDKGRFDAAQYGVTSWQQVSVSGNRGYLGRMAAYDGGKYTVPTVAWQYAPGAWALVQGVTTNGGSTSSLLEVANAVQPTVDVPIMLPFTLRYIPALPITDVTDDRSEGYAFTMQFGGYDTNASITIWPTADLTNYDSLSATRVLIDGQPGYYDSGQGFAVAYRGESIEIGATMAGSSSADDRVQRDVMAGLRWAPHGVAAEQAIP